MGLDVTKLQNDVLGTQWISLLAGLDPVGGGSKMDAKSVQVAQEMGKIQGYPIVTDGKYYPMPKVKPQEEPQPTTGGGLLGKAVGGLLKKKPDPEAEKAPVIAFYTEVKSVSVETVDAAAFQVPAGYKNKTK